jgi:hypothetical protein
VGPASKYRLGKRYVAPGAHRRRTHALVSQVRKVAEENGVDVSSQIGELESRAQQVRLVWASVRDCSRANVASSAVSPLVPGATRMCVRLLSGQHWA